MTIMAENYQSHQLSHQLGDGGNTAEQMAHLHEDEHDHNISPPPRQMPPMPPGDAAGQYMFNQQPGQMFPQQQMFQQQFPGNQGFPQQFQQPVFPGYQNQAPMQPLQQFPQNQPFPGQPQSQPAPFQTFQGAPMQQMAPVNGQFPPQQNGQFQMAPQQLQQQPMYTQQYRPNQFAKQPQGPQGHQNADPPPRNSGGYDAPRADNYNKGKGRDGSSFDRTRWNGNQSGGQQFERKGKGKSGEFRRDSGKGSQQRDGKGHSSGGKGYSPSNGKGQKGGGHKGFGKGQADILPEDCSELLYDFRVKFRKVELLDIVPHVVEFAKDQYGSRLIQSKLAVCTPDEKQLLYVAIKKEVKHLVLDPFANYVIQKFFEYGTLTQRRGLAAELRGSVLDLSFHMFGCWVMQRALEFLEGPGNSEQLMLSEELQNDVLRLVGNQNGNHVIQKCIEKMPTEQVDFILAAFTGEVKRMARHTYGCRVLQRLIEHCTVPQLLPIISELIDEAEELAKDEYGNYVIQSIAERTDTPHRPVVLQTICDKILDLSTDKYASNVCEKALVYSTDEDRHQLMNTVLGQDNDAEPPLFTMMRDRYANYIVQKMIELATPDQKQVLQVRLVSQIEDLRKFTYGKHIVSTLVRVGIVDKSVLEEMVFDFNNQDSADKQGQPASDNSQHYHDAQQH